MHNISILWRNWIGGCIQCVHQDSFRQWYLYLLCLNIISIPRRSSWCTFWESNSLIFPQRDRNKTHCIPPLVRLTPAGCEGDEKHDGEPAHGPQGRLHLLQETHQKLCRWPRRRNLHHRLTDPQVSSLTTANTTGLKTKIKDGCRPSMDVNMVNRQAVGVCWYLQTRKPRCDVLTPTSQNITASGRSAGLRCKFTSRCLFSDVSSINVPQDGFSLNTLFYFPAFVRFSVKK